MSEYVHDPFRTAIGVVLFTGILAAVPFVRNMDPDYRRHNYPKNTETPIVLRGEVSSYDRPDRYSRRISIKTPEGLVGLKLDLRGPHSATERYDSSLKQGDKAEVVVYPSDLDSQDGSYDLCSDVSRLKSVNGIPVK